jgi:hypothetical protein
MTKKTISDEKRNDKYSVTYEDEISISIWRYDKSKFRFGPIEVEHRLKKNTEPLVKNKKTQ